MRPTWSGTISFGLVNIPVGLFPATEDKDQHFHLLHDKDKGRIKNQRLCTICGNVVGADDLVKGFEYAKDEYVVVSDGELERAETGASDEIAIQDFVDPSEIDQIYYETPYYVQSTSKSTVAFSLLYEALKSSQKAGIAKVAFRTKERLAALVAGREGLVLYTLHFLDEIRAAEPIKSTAAIGERETKMAQSLIDSMTADFDPARYHDSSRETLDQIIRAKLEGKELPSAKRAAHPAEVIDLMKVLKESIAQNERGKPTSSKPPARRRADKAA